MRSPLNLYDLFLDYVQQSLFLNDVAKIFYALPTKVS